MNNKITLNVSDEHAGERLDKFVAKYCNDVSRTYVQDLIDEDFILVNKNYVKSSYKLKKDDIVSVLLPELKEPQAQPEKIKLDIVYEDNDVIVVNKPQGMATHPAYGLYQGTLVNALLYHCRDSLSGINGILRPGIVHRLDKETSGLIIACKNDFSHKEIAKQFKERKIKKSYLAIVHGKVKYDKGTINKPIGRHKTHREKMAVVQGGRDAITHFKVLKRVETIHELSLLECSLETGRTHQIRVHLASIGHPIVGDKTYGKKNDPVSKMMLHSYKLIFIHPGSKKEICLETEMPMRFESCIGKSVK